MRRPILNSEVKVDIHLNQPKSRTNVELTGAALEKKIRQARSSAYLNALTQLDGSGAVLSREKLNEILKAIESEFADLQPHQFPIGIISKCYLGEPYEVHTLDVRLEIVEHYKRGNPLPSGMERGRSLAVHPEYDYIEIFSDKICVVARNGNVSMITG